MKVALVAVSVLLALCYGTEVVFGQQGGGGGGEGFGGGRPPFGGGGKRRGPPPFPFPACQTWMNLVHQQMEQNMQNGEGGPWNCNTGSMEECRYNDMVTARLQISVEPPQECREQMNNFLDGVPISTTTTTTTITLTTESTN